MKFIPSKFQAAFKMKKFKSYSQIYAEANRQATKGLALEVRNEAVKLLTNISPGRKETRYSPKRDVTVSKPGDPPNTDLGVLRQGIKVEQVSETLVLVGTNVPYGRDLEFGSSAKNVAARPWLSVAFNIVASKAAKIRDKYFKNYVKANT